MAPKRPQVVFLRASTVRSGNALPSLHQNSQPMSQGTYSASSFNRSKTMRAASMTSWPTPSPGIHAILYLAIGCRSYRRALSPQVDEILGEHRPLACWRRLPAVADFSWFNSIALCDLNLSGGHSAGRRMQQASGLCSPDQSDFARSREATRFSAPPATINSCAAGLSAGKANDFPSMLSRDLP